VNALPLVILAVLLLGMFFFAQRNRQKAAAAEADRRQSIGVGTDVMTTSGLYGTVTAVYDDDTVLLSIAPGVEVRFALAALRHMTALPARYRPGAAASHDADAAEPATPVPPVDREPTTPDGPGRERPDA
jgi:preprotein translocase subunit YajC